VEWREEEEEVEKEEEEEEKGAAVSRWVAEIERVAAVGKEVVFNQEEEQEEEEVTEPVAAEAWGREECLGLEI